MNEEEMEYIHTLDTASGRLVSLNVVVQQLSEYILLFPFSSVGI